MRTVWTIGCDASQGNYGTFDLTRILLCDSVRTKAGIATYSGMHAVEDYIVSRYQMYM